MDLAGISHFSLSDANGDGLSVYALSLKYRNDIAAIFTYKVLFAISLRYLLLRAISLQYCDVAQES